MYIDMYHYALLVHYSYQVPNVLLSNEEQAKLHSRKQVFGKFRSYLYFYLSVHNTRCRHQEGVRR